MGYVEINHGIDGWNAGRYDGHDEWGYVVYGAESLEALCTSLDKLGYKYDKPERR